MKKRTSIIFLSCFLSLFLVFASAWASSKCDTIEDYNIHKFPENINVAEFKYKTNSTDEDGNYVTEEKEVYYIYGQALFGYYPMEFLTVTGDSKAWFVGSTTQPLDKTLLVPIGKDSKGIQKYNYALKLNTCLNGLKPGTFHCLFDVTFLTASQIQLSAYTQLWENGAYIESCLMDTANVSLLNVTTKSDDNDGVSVPYDNCPFDSNSSQGDSDWDGIGDACEPEQDTGEDEVLEDADEDSISDDEDNCPDIANSDQADADEDGWGDVCDFGSDNSFDDSPDASNSEEGNSANDDGNGDENGDGDGDGGSGVKATGDCSLNPGATPGGWIIDILFLGLPAALVGIRRR